MTNRQIGGFACLLASAALLVSGMKIVMDGPPLPNRAGFSVGYVVGAFLPSGLAFGIGWRLMRKPR